MQINRRGKIIMVGILDWVSGPITFHDPAPDRATSIAFMAHAMEKRRGELISQPLGRIWEELATAAYDAEREGK